MRSGVEMTMGMGFPMGMGISWESHGNGTKIRSIVGILMGMGNNLHENGIMAMIPVPFPWELIPIDDCSVAEFSILCEV